MSDQTFGDFQELNVGPRRGQVQLGQTFYALMLGVLIFLASDPMYPLLMRGPSEWVATVPGLDGVRRLVWLGIYGIMMLGFIVMHRRIVPALTNQLYFFLTMAFFIISSLWAHSTSEGIIGGVQALFTMVFGIVIGYRLGSEGIVKGIFVSGILTVAASLMFVVVFPEHAFGYHHNKGALRGIYPEKNLLAQYLSYACWASVFMCLIYPRSWMLKAYALLVVILCFACISSIALLQLVVIFGSVFYLFVTRRVAHRGAIALLLTLSAIMAVVMVLPIVLAALGEDLTFNGRTVLWSHLIANILEQPWIGYGYRGFWHTSAAEQMRSILGWSAYGAHNVWVQAALFGGIVGLGLWIAQWWAVLLKACRDFGSNEAVHKSAMSVFVFMALLWSMFETTQLQHFTHNAILTGLAFAMRSPGFR
ncbi:MAG: O-antigen ligase family protein [Pseudomonadota bacterium]